MKFPNWFKIVWWTLLLSVLTVFLWSRLPALQIGESVPTDIVIFLVWIGLALAPIFSEVGLFGLRFKQQIDEIRRDIATLKIDQNQTVVVNLATQQQISRKQILDDLYAYISEDSSLHGGTPHVEAGKGGSGKTSLHSYTDGVMIARGDLAEARKNIYEFEAKVFSAIRAGKSPIHFIERF